MQFDRLDLLAERMADYSLKLSPGEHVMIAAGHSAIPLVRNFAKACLDRQAVPLPYFMDEELTRLFLCALSGEDADTTAAAVASFMEPLHQMMEGVSSVVVIRSKESDTPFNGAAPAALQAYQQHIGRAFHTFTNQKKWVVLDWPTSHQAAKAGMTHEDFYTFVMDLSLVDYAAMYIAAQPAKTVLDAADRVHIKGQGTDLRFSKKGINTIIGAAANSYPDGELYTAPVRDSVEGYVTFTVPSIYLGHTFDGIRLEFKEGKIIKATCAEGDKAALNAILATDEGASYIGEFALGINPYLNRPMNDIHYDEKINGSFHLTPGNCYNEAYNGNRSAIHWDLVCMQDKAHGGGEIWLDGELLRKDGIFVMENFKGLNTESILDGGE
jgi:aminopeptidase